ncbi:hypothetical protein FQR65_LT11989 [Abscondita terminalis]|nr:hypothetical protein FQR65_LT11989 [Abscondita terminalis]
MIKIFLEFAFYEITMIFILYLVTLHLTVHDDYMGSHSWAFYVSVINAASYGIEKYPITTAYIACTVCFGWCSFLWQTYFRAYCMWSVAERNLKYFKFRNKFHLIQTQLKNLNISKDVTESVDQFYITSCKLDKHSVKSWKNLAILPRSMEEEFSVEIYWFAFMHSKLFRNFELPFLRSLSLLMKSELTIPGEIVFDKSNLKDKMIYVQSGIIQILSGEDDETPLFSFSGGTCIGESSLILAHKSNTIVRCKTSCRLHILYRKDFNKFLTKNVRIYTQLRETFFQRLNQAKEDWALSQEIDKDCISDRINYMTVIWLKSTLHKLMSKDKTTFDKHVCQNVFLRDEFDEDNFKHRHFTAENLDLIAISERLQLVTDSVFVKSSCPCILQPNSVLVTLWDFSIAIVACTVCVILPYFAFLENSVPIWYEFYISIITVLWWIDLYLQASTAIKTPNRIIAHLESIIVYRIHSLSFLLDLFAAVPFEMFSPIIFVTSTKNNIIFLELNRVIKLQKIILIYRNWEKKLTSRNIIVTYCYYQLCILYITYILSCISFYVHRNGSSLSKENYFAWTFFDVNQLINGASVFNIFSENSEHTLYYGIISIFASFISIVYSVYVISTYYKIRLKISTSNKYYKNSGATFNSMAIASKYKKRIMKNIESQVENTSLPAKEYLNLPSSIYKKIAQEVFEPLLQDVPFFKHLPNEIITNLNMQCQITVIPQNEKICCTGQILNDLIILESGCCKTRSTTSSSELFIKAGNALAILESYTHKPVVNTIVTATHCRLLIISRTDFLRILSDYPLEVFHIETALSETDAKRELLHLYYQNNTYSAYKYILLSRNEKSIRTFGYHLEIDSYEEYDYYVPFDRLGHFSFIQYFLMRFTIYPNSNFLFIWELVRSVCAVTCGILFPLIYTNIATDRGLSSIMIFLDAMAWVDIYLRFHVCFYNDKGILVSHPLFTSQYYLKRAFVVDLLGVFPFKMFARTKSPEILTGLQLNRLLQMYRFLGFTKSVCQERPLQPSMTILFQLFPSIFALCFLISFINIISICSFTSSDTVICVNDSWAVFNNFVDPLTPLRLQLYNVYMVIGIVTRPGIQGYSIHSTRTMLTVYTLTVIKIIIFLYTSCLITKLYSTRTPSMWKNQNYMWRAIYFMQKYNVKKNLQNKFITYFELKFRQQNISTSISILHGALQEDLLYDVYGCVLNESSIFTGYGDSEHFFRSLLVEVSHDIIIKNSLAVQINDVNERISVIFKGTACVIGADGSTITFLSVGSFFGNLVESERSRQTVSVLAVGNIEILTAKTTKFYEILKKYSNLYHRYKRLIGFNVDYLKSKPQSSHGISQYQFYPVSLQLVLYFSILLNFTGIFRFLILGYIYSGIQIHFVQRNQYLKKIAVIINHMKQEQVSSSFYTKIINYVGMLWRTDNGPTFPYLLLELPQHLRESILNDVFSTYINNNPIFTKCHKDFKRQVVSYLKNETFFKRDYIVFNGSVNGCMYFVHDGEVQAIIDNQGERCVVNILKSGSYFGIGQGIFPGKPYLHSFQALKTTTILMLEFEKWKHLLDFFPASEETIYQQYYLFEDPYA